MVRLRSLPCWTVWRHAAGTDTTKRVHKLARTISASAQHSRWVEEYRHSETNWILPELSPSSVYSQEWVLGDVYNIILSYSMVNQGDGRKFPGHFIRHLWQIAASFTQARVMSSKCNQHLQQKWVWLQSVNERDLYVHERLFCWRQHLDSVHGYSETRSSQTVKGA